MLCFLCSYEKIFEHRLHYAHFIVCKCVCAAIWEQQEPTTMKYNFNVSTHRSTTTMSTGIFSLFQFYFFPFKCVEYDLSLLFTRTHRYSSTFKETKEELCCVRKNQYFSRFSLFVYLFVFFSVHGHVLWLSLGYAEGENRVRMCVLVDFSVFFKFGFKLSSGFMLLLSLFLIFQ